MAHFEFGTQELRNSGLKFPEFLSFKLIRPRNSETSHYTKCPRLGELPPYAAFIPMDTELHGKSFALGVLLGAIFVSTATLAGVLIGSRLVTKPHGTSAQTAAVSPDAWEYNLIRGRASSPEMQDRINAAAGEGWDFVAAFPYTDSAYAVMRRLRK
jgi:hypothetical protein